MIKYQKGYIFNGYTFVVNKDDVHNATDDMFVDAAALLPVSDLVPVVRCGERRRATSGGGGYVWCGRRTIGEAARYYGLDVGMISSQCRRKSTGRELTFRFT